MRFERVEDVWTYERRRGLGTGRRLVRARTCGKRDDNNSNNVITTAGTRSIRSRVRFSAIFPARRRDVPLSGRIAGGGGTDDDGGRAIRTPNGLPIMTDIIYGTGATLRRRARVGWCRRVVGPCDFIRKYNITTYMQIRIRIIIIFRCTHVEHDV